MSASCGLYLCNAELEHCSSAKEKIDIIFPYTAFHYIIDGHGWFNGTRLGPGQFFCALRNERTCYHVDPSDPWTYIYFDLYGNLTENSCFVHQLCGEEHYGQFTWEMELKDLLQLFKNYTHRNVENIDFMRACGDMLISLHQTQPRRTELSSKAYEHMLDIKNYIDSNYYQKLSIEEIAQQFHLSRTYIRNLFTRYMDISPKQYLQKVRMEKAAELLLKTRHEIGLIAKSVGYEDLLCFSKAFKQFTGVSPSGYRKNTEDSI